MRFEGSTIPSPKRNRKLQTGWEGFFPYYAGYPEAFAQAVLSAAHLKAGAVILDPWNGSGTTTYAAARLGLDGIGLDINPAMVVVARARLLPASEADSILSLAEQVIRLASKPRRIMAPDDALTVWFSSRASRIIRHLESSIRRHLVSELTLSFDGVRLDNLSGIAATFYVALFALCRRLTQPLRATNPTWIKKPASANERIDATAGTIMREFRSNLLGMAEALRERSSDAKPGNSEVRIGDSSSLSVPRRSVDLILTSPPYCTRIDYAAATRVELAVMAPLLITPVDELRRQMIGSIRVPTRQITANPLWGDTCNRFLRKLRRHPSKASAGYYTRTHLDYFDKMSRSIGCLSSTLKPSGSAVFVVQDSFYKEIHNDLPSIIAEMFEVHGLKLYRKDAFHIPHSMSGINPHTRTYQRGPGATESVLFFGRP